jgi:Leucine-rich repeat (LRR) protein
MGDPLEQARLLVEKIRTFIGILRNSPTEIVTATLAALCLSAATFLLGHEFVKALLPPYALEPIRIAFFAVGTFFVAWTFFRIWKQAIPPKLEQEPRPSAIKGTMPFTDEDEDGQLFPSLGRKTELESLLAQVLDDQIPLVVVMGESGVGKTSLLRAGLSLALEKRNVRVIYWEALPTNPADRLLHAVQSGWDAAKDGTAPNNLDEAIRGLAAAPNHTVIVLDQFEQLSFDTLTHQPLFEALKAFVTSGLSPYRLTWVVAFRRDYDPFWRDFELSISRFHPPMVSLRLFEKDQARGIMATLAAAADFTLDDELTKDLSNAAADRNGRVSPVDIGIGMLVLSGLAIRKNKNKRHLNKDDYRFAGGAEGILTAYVSDRLERFGEGERQGVMKALLALCDLDNNQRIAEGKAVDELSASAQLLPNRLNGRLEYLASPQVRLLERVPFTAESPQKYRLTHDRLVASLRQLTGLILADAEQARLTFDSAFRAWLDKHRKRFLLTGSDLKKVVKNLGQFSGGTLSGERAEFLKLSLQRRFFLRLITSGVVLVLVAILSVSWREYQAFQAKTDLAQAGLPSDLYDYQFQPLLELTISISNLDLPHTNRLQRLLVKNPALRDIQGRPPSRLQLVLANCKISTLAALEKLEKLTTLDLSRNWLQNLAGLAIFPRLTTLDLNGNRLPDLAGLEILPQLTTLDLSGNRLQDLAGLEKLAQLTTLYLGDNRLPNLAGLEKLPQLTTLNLSGSRLPDLAGLEKLARLTTLDLNGNRLQDLAGLEKLPQLTTLNLSYNRLQNLTGLEKLARLTTLDLSGNPLPDLAGLEKLAQLTTLYLGNNSLQNFAGLEKLDKLTTLNLSGNRLRDAAGLEKLAQLTTLDLSGNHLQDLSGLERLPRLTTLNLSYNGLPNLTGLEKLAQLTTLNLSGNRLPDLAGLEKLAQLTTLDLGDNSLANLGGLKQLSRLTTLNLSDNRLQNLAGLEKLAQLTTLYLSNNLLQDLTGLEKLPRLTTLNLNGNPLRKLAGLEKLTSLETLDISYCPIESLKPLAGLQQLKTLYLQGTGIRSLEHLPPSVTTIQLGD